MNRLDRNGIVFGASSGIGAAIAERLIDAGATVFAASRRGEGPQHVRCNHLKADVRRYESVLEAFNAAVVDRPVDFVVNSAGVGLFAPLHENRSSEWREIIETNFVGAVNLCAAVVQHADSLLDFVHIGSVAAYRPSRTPGNQVYSAAKAGAASIVEQTRGVLRAGNANTRVSVLAPGYVQGTEFENRYFMKAPGAALDLYGGSKHLDPGDVAEVVAWLMSLPLHAEGTTLVLRPTEQPD